MKLLMENFKKFLNEAKKETASVEEIEKVILAVLKKEGGAAGLKPIEDALSELDKEMPEGFDLMDHLKKMKDSIVKIHDDGDVIEMGGLEEGELEEKLTGDQYKIDVAKPKGKITAADFEKLRKLEEMIQEEINILQEQSVNNLVNQIAQRVKELKNSKDKGSADKITGQIANLLSKIQAGPGFTQAIGAVDLRAGTPLMAAVALSPASQNQKNLINTTVNNRMKTPKATPTPASPRMTKTPSGAKIIRQGGVDLIRDPRTGELRRLRPEDLQSPQPAADGDGTQLPANQQSRGLQATRPPAKAGSTAQATSRGKRKCPKLPLSKGCTGDLVKTVQKMLLTLGYKLGKAGADGDYGRRTKRAVKAFQKAEGLKVDGVAGKNTVTALKDMAVGTQVAFAKRGKQVTSESKKKV